MTVLANGRRIIHQAGGGKITAISVNYTGPQQIPVAYPSIAEARNLTRGSTRVLINGFPVATMNSYIAFSKGDEAGTGGGIYSGTINGRAEFITHSPDTYIEGSPVIREGDLGVSNCRNTEPAPIVIPS